MSKKTHSVGNIVTVTLAADKNSGEMTNVGSLVGVVQESKLTGESAEIAIEGVHKVPKASADVMAVGALINYNNTNANFQNATSDKDGAAVVIEAAGNGDTEVVAKLLP